MSKALQYALEKHRTGQKITPDDVDRQGFTVQERTLLVNARMCLESPESSLYQSWAQCEAIARSLDAGGVLDDPFVLRMRHMMAFESNSKMMQDKSKAHLQMPGVDDIAAASICHHPLSELRECSIRDLLHSSKGVPRSGYFVKARIIEPSFQISSIQCLVEDAEGTVINLSLYNFVALYGQRDYVKDLAPVGACVTIKHPYLKLSNHGTLALRVDNPSNITIEWPAVDNLGVVAMKGMGNDFFAKDQHASAIEWYSKGLLSCEQLKVDLHSNRAAAHLHVGDWEAAVSDCNVVLSLEPEHVKAKTRLDEAQRNLATASKAQNIDLDTIFDSLTTATSPCDDVSSACPNALKAAGNAHFKAKNFQSARRSYTAALAALEDVQKALLANRAASRLTLGGFDAAVADCDTVLAMDPTHAKALARKETAMAAAAVAADQKEGTYNFLTLPHNPRLQDRVANYLGPIVIRSAGAKGRGLFVTRDVKSGELLFVEKAIKCMVGDALKGTIATNWATKEGSKGTTFELQTDLTILANKDPAVNAQLSYLVHDKAAPNTVIPDIDWFRQNAFPPVQTISAKRVSGAVALNCFSFAMDPEPTEDERRAMEIACHSGDRLLFSFAFNTRRAQRNQRIASDSTPQYAKEGTALWIVASFMNHSSHESIAKEFFGKLMFVYAARDLKAGEELTTSYSSDKDSLKRTWGING